MPPTTVKGSGSVCLLARHPLLDTGTALYYRDSTMAQPNFKNRTLWTGDNLDIMRGLNSEIVDLIYLDPPFNSNQDYAAPVGSAAAGAAFKDTWTLSDVDLAWHGEIAEANPPLYRVIDAAREAHGKGMQSYLIMMAVRLLEMKRILKPTGSIYLHCDPTASHYLKLVMDAVFGKDNFQSEITWKRYSGFKRKTARKFPQKTDTILCYARSSSIVHFNTQYAPHKPEYIKRFKRDTEGRLYRDDVNPTRGGRRTIYLDETKGEVIDSLWIDINPVNPVAKERIGYPTQKPLALLERIIKASSNKGDVVLDPFCGCATALVAAEKLEREWVGIDLSAKAIELVNQRLQQPSPLGIGSLFHHSYVTARTDIPRRTDQGKLPHYKTHKQTLFGRQEGHCAGCRHDFLFRNFTIDHVVPQSKGGTDHIDNLQLLCSACNSEKGTRTQEEFLAILKRKGIRS